MGDFWERWVCWGFWNLSKTTSTVCSELCLFHIWFCWGGQAGSNCFYKSSVLSFPFLGFRFPGKCWTELWTHLHNSQLLQMSLATQFLISLILVLNGIYLSQNITKNLLNFMSFPYPPSKAFLKEELDEKATQHVVQRFNLHHVFFFMSHTHDWSKEPF